MANQVKEEKKTRIDKWLWAVRIFKSRTLANDVVKRNKVSLNGKNAKPSTSVSIGDRLKVMKNGFELEFEVKVDDGLNSGVQIRSKLKGVDGKNSYGGRVFGPQVEIESGPGQSGFIYGEATGLNWLSPEPKSDDKSKKQHDHFKNGQWNKYRIVAKGANIKVWINETAICDLTHEEIFKSHPKGLIGLQVHGIKKGSGPFEVRWRNLKIKPLK